MGHFSIALLLLAVLIGFPAHAQEPATAEEFSQRAMARFESNDFDGAIADFTKVIEMNGPGQEYCYYFRGMSHFRKGNLDQAIADLGKAIEIKSNPRFYNDRGNLRAIKGDSDGALADFTKTIEIAPQNAKAYCDRAMVHLMRGETKDAETDSKRCFELDPSLEMKFRIAAGPIGSRSGPDVKAEQPADVKIVKFNWTETPVSKIQPDQSIPVPYSHVSSSGTRVLANPNEKGMPGPSVLLDPAVRQPGTPIPNEKNKTLIEHKFTVALKNAGSKPILAIRWGYVFDPKDPKDKSFGYQFLNKTSIAPGKEKTLTESIVAAPASLKLPPRSSRGLYEERVVIIQIDYADGSTWQAPP